MVTIPRFRCLVRGLGDVGSAVAHTLHCAGHAVALHDAAAPTVHRRRMAFVDAAFDGRATLDGVVAELIEDPAVLGAALGRAEIPVNVGPLEGVLAAVTWDVLVDARLRKRTQPEDQRGRARLVVGLGPGFVVGDNCDIAIETSWADLGRIIARGATAPLAGEPRAIAGRGRERLIYAPVSGTFIARRDIGALVTAGEVVAQIGATSLTAPLGGAVRGLTRSGTAVAAGTKVVEIDPRGADGVWSGLGERPRRIAEAVLRVVEQRL